MFPFSASICYFLHDVNVCLCYADMSKLQMDFMLLKERLAQLEDGWTNGGFEWLDGMLVQALQAGDWLLMDNVNFCRSGHLGPHVERLAWNSD